MIKFYKRRPVGGEPMAAYPNVSAPLRSRAGVKRRPRMQERKVAEFHLAASLLPNLYQEKTKILATPITLHRAIWAPGEIGVFPREDISGPWKFRAFPSFGSQEGQPYRCFPNFSGNKKLANPSKNQNFLKKQSGQGNSPAISSQNFTINSG